MPFVGVPGSRARFFARVPVVAEVAVGDPDAWRLHPRHRHLYDKLDLALAQGIKAAPFGVAPADCGVDGEAWLMVKPVVNLWGMSIGARRYQAKALVAMEEGQVPPGSFWSELLTGEHTSTDCLVRNGEVVWFGHTLAASQKDSERPFHWQVGVALPEEEEALRPWVAKNLAGYTGLCNVERIGGVMIEVHLRGSVGFFEFYPPGFVAAWARLVDAGVWQGLPSLLPGYVVSVFALASKAVPLSFSQAVADAAGAFPDVDVTLTLDDEGRPVMGRVAVLRGRDLSSASVFADRLREMLLG